MADNYLPKFGKSRALQEKSCVGMRLKQIGARIIVAGIVLGVVGINVGHRATWLYKFYPLGTFICFAVGAIVGVAGMIGAALDRRNNSN
jgi:hypothetical protein